MYSSAKCLKSKFRKINVQKLIFKEIIHKYMICYIESKIKDS